MKIKLIAVAALAAGVLPPWVAADEGLGVSSPDGSLALRLHGLLQADGRFYAGDPAGQGFNDTFLFRRVEPVLEFTLGKLVYFKLHPQFAGDAASTADVFGELRFAPAVAVRVGKFKAPLVLENLQPAGAIAFAERGFPTELAANRDLGVQLQGELFAGTTTYAVGYFNGAADGRDAAASDTDNRKEVAARVFFEPFRNGDGFFRGLGLGLAGSQGGKLNAIETTTTAATASANFNNTLPRYRSPGQNTIFTYLLNAAPTSANTVVAAGDHRRLTPQLYFYRGAFGLLAEQIASAQEVAIGGATQEFTHEAFEGTLSWVLTGEDAGYKGVKPTASFAAGAPGWGAFEVAARYGLLDVDDAVFPAYADPARSVSAARTIGAVVSWYLTPNARLMLDYDETRFTGGAPAGGDRDREQALFTRLQLSF